MIDTLQPCDSMPERSYAQLHETGEVILIKRQQTGFYRLCNVQELSQAESNVLVHLLNSNIGVLPYQAAAMFVGSMFGWDVPGAQPKAYFNDPIENVKAVYSCD